MSELAGAPFGASRLLKGEMVTIESTCQAGGRASRVSQENPRLTALSVCRW